MTRTPTLPLNDKKMWRKLIALTHPDRGGDHDMCIWTQNMREYICNDLTSPRTAQPEPRIIYEDGRVPFTLGSIFEELTARAIERAGAVDAVYARLLLLLDNCQMLGHLVHEEQRGASYKRLAYIAHLLGMSKSERIEWYRIAESIPLADRHAGHLIKRLKEAA